MGFLDKIAGLVNTKRDSGVFSPSDTSSEPVIVEDETPRSDEDVVSEPSSVAAAPQQPAPVETPVSKQSVFPPVGNIFGSPVQPQEQVSQSLPPQQAESISNSGAYAKPLVIKEDAVPMDEISLREKQAKEAAMELEAELAAGEDDLKKTIENLGGGTIVK